MCPGNCRGKNKTKPSDMNESLVFEVMTVTRLFQLPGWPVVCASACQWVTNGKEKAFI